MPILTGYLGMKRATTVPQLAQSGITSDSNAETCLLLIEDAAAPFASLAIIVKAERRLHTLEHPFATRRCRPEPNSQQVLVLCSSPCHASGAENPRLTAVTAATMLSVFISMARSRKRAGKPAFELLPSLPSRLSLSNTVQGRQRFLKGLSTHCLAVRALRRIAAAPSSVPEAFGLRPLVRSAGEAGTLKAPAPARAEPLRTSRPRDSSCF